MVTIEQNAHKVVYLATLYPKHTMPMIFSLFEMPAIDINSAMWYAVDKGWLVDNGAENAPTITPPAEWDLGEDISLLQEKLLLGIRHVAKTEQDIEEQFMRQWCYGYPAQNLLIALKDMLGDGRLASYSIEDQEEDGNTSTYTFFTLPENADKRWGEKQFKDIKKIKETARDIADDLPQAPDFPGNVAKGPTKH